MDLKEKVIFPCDIVTSASRPDMLILSRETRAINFIELTVPWEDRLGSAHELKKKKYQDLLDESIRKGWQTRLLPIEVGCGG